MVQIKFHKSVFIYFNLHKIISCNVWNITVWANLPPMLRIDVLAFYHAFVNILCYLIFLCIGYMWVPDLYALSGSIEILIQILYIICHAFLNVKNE